MIVPYLIYGWIDQENADALCASPAARSVLYPSWTSFYQTFFVTASLC